MSEAQQEYENKAIEKYEEFNLANIRDMVAEYQTIMVPEGDEDAFKIARRALTICVRTRTAIDKRRKQNGADLREALAEVNTSGYMLIDLVAPAEKHLKGQVEPEQERLKQIERDRRKAHLDKVDGWMTEAAKYGSQYGYDIISKMDDDQFAEHLFQIKEKHDFNQKLLKRQAEKQKAELKAKAEQLEKVRLEQEELMQKVREEQEKVTAELEAKQSAIDAKEKALQDEKDRIESKKMLKEAEGKKAARLEQEEKEKERLEQEAAERTEALKPEKQKCIDWVELIRGTIPTWPDLENDVLRVLISKATHQIENVLTNFHKDIEEL